MKRFDILSFQIMLDYLHLLTQCQYPDRTLESMRSGGGDNVLFTRTKLTASERTFSKVRSQNKYEYTISDLMQSIKGNFSRKVHQGNIWQKRFYTRIVNNRKYLETVIHYIKQNPIKAQLPRKYHQPPYQYFNWQLIHQLF